MEVTRKQLHHHALPIALIVLGLFGLAVVAQAQYSATSLSDIGKALTTRVVHVKPTKNGLAEIGVNSTEKQRTGVGSLSQTGRSAEVMLLMQ